jgi:hypothetical protein
MRRVLVCIGACLGLAAVPRTSATAESAAAFPADGPVVWPGEINRRPATDRSGSAHGPWRAAVVVAALPRKGIKRGDAITVVPLRPGLATVEVKVTSVEAQEATDLAQATWLVEAETTLDELLSAKPDPGRTDEHPLEAVVVYPAQPHARLMANRAVGQDVPKDRGCSPRTLWGAIDLDDDGRADAEIFRFCCERPKTTWKSSGQTPCNSNCESIFLRSGAGPWKAVYETGES